MGVLLLGGLVRLFVPWHAEFFFGGWVGATVAALLYEWQQPPEVIARWGRGAEGERLTAKALRPLVRDGAGWHVRHDLAGRRGNVDHVVVGPAGVFMLDSKNLVGRVEVIDGILSVRFHLSPINDYAMPNLPRALRAAARGIRDALQVQLGWIIDVHPVVVIHGDFQQRIADSGQLSYVAAEALGEWLERQPPRLALIDQPVVIAALDNLPAAPEIPTSDASEA